MYANDPCVPNGADRVSSDAFRKVLYTYLLLLVPLACLSATYDPYALDGDAVAYMDLADLIHAHRWAGAVNGYWNPLYPALLALGQILFHPTRANELRVYYAMNLLLFALQIGAMLVFTRALVRLRTRLQPHVEQMFCTAELQLLGVALQTMFLTRELSIAKVRPDGLLEALLLLALAMLMESLAARSLPRSLCFASLTGMFFGLAYLTKSIAFPVAVIAIAVLVLFSWMPRTASVSQAMLRGLACLTLFALMAGPYVSALSHQKHRLDVGDSGGLNYAWCVSGTCKMHLQPWMAGQYGSATVHLTHPEIELMRQPGIYSYRAHAVGTYPPWFDPSYFNERIKPVFVLRKQLRTSARNVVLTARYVVEHPEPLLLLIVLLTCGVRTEGIWSVGGPCLCTGLVIWSLYLAVALEGRYVSIAYAAVLLPLFASLTPRGFSEGRAGEVRRTTSTLLILYACIAMADLLRLTAENRRNERAQQAVPAWRDHNIYGAGEALTQLGIMPGDAVACIGTKACVYDHYWARLAGARILAEVYMPAEKHLADQLDGMANREDVIRRVQGQGARVMVGSFDPGEMNGLHPAANGWIRLGETNFYALPLNITPTTGGAVH